LVKFSIFERRPSKPTSKINGKADHGIISQTCDKREGINKTLNYYNRDISQYYLLVALFQWPNHGGGILNRREAHHETKINPKVVAKLTTRWRFYTGDSVTATPAVWNGVVYFPSYNGNLYAICAKTGDVIWQKNLTQITKSPIAILSRTTPVVTKDLLLVAIFGPALVLAVDRKMGDLVWSTLLDPHPLAVITMSGTAYKR